MLVFILQVVKKKVHMFLFSSFFSIVLNKSFSIIEVKSLEQRDDSSAATETRFNSNLVM